MLIPYGEKVKAYQVIKYLRATELNESVVSFYWSEGVLYGEDYAGENTWPVAVVRGGDQALEDLVWECQELFC